MTGVRWAGVRLLVVAACGAVVAAELSAQPQGPIKLFPGVAGEDGGRAGRPPVRPGRPLDDDSGGAVREDPALPAQGPATVVVQGLDAPSIDALGLEDGLDPRIWEKSSVDLVTRLIEELPVPQSNPPLIDFTRRLLVTGAPTAGTLAPGTMLASRIEQLIRLGALDDAAALLERIPETDVDEPVTRRAAELALWRGEEDAACARGAAIDPSSGGTFWGKLRVFCRQSAGAEAEAELALALLRDSVDYADRRFVALAEGRSDEELMTGEPWTALQVSMLSRRGGRLPGPALAAPPAALAIAVARAPDLAPGTPLELAERAFLIGALERDRLVELYRSEAGQADAGEQSGPQMRAAMLEQIGSAATPADRARLFDQLWWATPPEERVLTAYLFAPVLNALGATEQLLFGAPAIARALLAASYPRPAARWLDLLADAASDDASARDALAALRPLFAIGAAADAAPALDLTMLEAWRAASDPDPSQEAHLLAAAEAVRGKLPLKVWWAADRRHLDPVPALGTPVFWRILERARERDAHGEAMLAGLNLLAGEPAGAHPEAVRAALGAVRAAGFAEVARAIAAASLIRLGL